MILVLQGNQTMLWQLKLNIIMDNKIQISDVILIESLFNRERMFDFKDEKLDQGIEVGINSNINSDESKAEVQLTITYSLKAKEEVAATAKVMMAAVFHFDNYKEIPIERFCEVNGAAIIYPYIRVHITNITNKAGMMPVVLPPLNFIKLYEEKKRIDSKD